MKELRITAKDAGQRLNKYLGRIMPAAGSGFLYKMLRKKNITLNDGKAEGNETADKTETVTRESISSEGRMAEARIITPACARATLCVCIFRTRHTQK